MFRSPLENDFVCPICGDTIMPLLQVGSPYPILERLQIIGGGSRMQKCHGCGCSDRDRLIYLYLHDELKVHIPDSKIINVLHVAPEHQIAKWLMNIPHIRYTAIDSMEQEYVYPSYIVKMNLLNLAIDDNSIDLLICNHVLQDIVDDRKAMSEIRRVLRPNGQAILQVPISPKLDKIAEHTGEKPEEYCIEHYGQRFHKRIYNRDGYISRLKESGLNVAEVNISRRYPKHSLNKDESIYIATKKR